MTDNKNRMTPKDARKYIGNFHLVIGSPPLQFVDTGAGRVWIKDMTDDQAVAIAFGLSELEFEGNKRKPKQ